VEDGEWWKRNLTSLFQFKNLGHVNVPTADKQLHSWILKQREQWKLAQANDQFAQITSSQIQKLAWVGLGNTMFGPINARWDEMFLQLAKFKEEHGHLRVPSMEKDFASLYKVFLFRALRD
jgi:hypothetical protein